MAGQILVPLRGSDRVEQFLPYLEKVVQPGLKVIFLIHYRIPAFNELTSQLLAIHTGVIAARLPDRFNHEEILKRHIQLARQEVIPACLALRNFGIEVSASVFASSVRKVVRQYAEKGDVHLVLMRRRPGNWLTRPAHRLASLFHSFEPQILPPVLLLHPSSIVGRF